MSGGGGIRTPGDLSATPVFKTGDQKWVTIESADASAFVENRLARLLAQDSGQLRELLGLWPHIPDALKSSIVTLVKSTVTPPKQEQQAKNAAVSRAEQRRQAAQEYLRRGWKPIPVPLREKGPRIKGWQNLRIEEKDIDDAFKGDGNISILLGKPSGELVDIDLDCPEARELADKFLPPTLAVTGRKSAPKSHRWYICPDVTTYRFRDPETKACTVEIRSTGTSTLVGPSIHPTGEQYDHLQGEPAIVDKLTLDKAVRDLAQAVLDRRYGKSVVRQTPPQAAAQRPEVRHDTDEATLVRRASAYLDKIPPAVSGQGGHRQTYIAATAMVHGFGLSETAALDLLVRCYNPKCSPPWTEAELRHKVQDAKRRSHPKPFGWLAKSTVQQTNQRVAVRTPNGRPTEINPK